MPGSFRRPLRPGGQFLIVYNSYALNFGLPLDQLTA